MNSFTDLYDGFGPASFGRSLPPIEEPDQYEVGNANPADGEDYARAAFVANVFLVTTSAIAVIAALGLAAYGWRAHHAIYPALRLAIHERLPALVIDDINAALQANDTGALALASCGHGPLSQRGLTVFKDDKVDWTPGIHGVSKLVLGRQDCSMPLVVDATYKAGIAPGIFGMHVKVRLVSYRMALLAPGSGTGLPSDAQTAVVYHHRGQ